MCENVENRPVRAGPLKRDPVERYVPRSGVKLIYMPGAFGLRSELAFDRRQCSILSDKYGAQSKKSDEDDVEFVHFANSDRPGNTLSRRGG